MGANHYHIPIGNLASIHRTRGVPARKGHSVAPPPSSVPEMHRTGVGGNGVIHYKCSSVGDSQGDEEWSDYLLDKEIRCSVVPRLGRVGGGLEYGTNLHLCDDL